LVFEVIDTESAETIAFFNHPVSSDASSPENPRECPHKPDIAVAIC